MIKILSNTKQTLHLLSQGQLKDYYTEADLQAAEKLIHFSTPAVNAANLIEENYIQTPTDIYVIKEVNRSDADWVEVFGKLDLDALKATLILTYTSEERLISQVLTDVLASTGWTYVLNDLPTRRRTIRIDEPTYAYNIIMDAMKLYGFEVWFDTVAKVVNIYQVKGSDRGAYVYTDLNMKKLEVQSDTYDFRTRLYAYGKDGLTFADINNGKEYVENHTHSTKILEAIWKDERYTVKENLMADAQAKIDILAKPRQSYIVEVVELAKLNPIYSILDFQLGDSVKIIDKINAKQDTQRIVKLTDYPITPERNVAELANSKITLVQSNNEEAIKTAINAVSNEIVVVQTELMKAIDAATERITGETGGYLVIRTNAEGKPYELLIMDTDDIATATNVWRWNQAGLGFSSSGYNGSYGTAITADGKINADFITVGTLSASLVKTGLLASNDNSSWIDLDTGYFNFKNKVKFDANGFSLTLSNGNSVETEINNAKNAAIAAAEADATSKANAAQTAATNAANAKAEAERVLAEAYADGIVDAEEQARIDAVDAAAEAAAKDAAAKAAAAEAAAKAYADTQLGTFATTIGNTLDGLQDQIDGSITTWFYGVVPTNSNAPASTWTTTTLKNNHLGDLYYDTVTGYAYRWQVTNNVYSWVRITDTDVTKALEDASKAQDTADSKRRVFVVTPTTPYEVGDLWAQGASGELMRCKTTALTGSYSSTHWEKASKYTDDTVAKAAQTAAANAQTAANTANSALADIASDSKLTATEKQATKKEWDAIVAEKAGIEAQATLYSITTEKTNYTNAYNALNTYITPLLSSLTTTSSIVGTTFRTKFTNYYTARQVLLDKVAAKAKDYINSEISAVDGRVDLKVSKNDIINQINISTEGISISGSKIDITSNSTYTTKIGALEGDISTVTNTANDTKDALDNLQVGGRNLLFGLKTLERTINGVTLTYSNGKITLNGTCSASANFVKNFSIDGGIYTLSSNNPEIAPNAGTRIDVYGTTVGLIQNSMSTVNASTTSDLNAGTGSFRLRIEGGTTYTNFELTPKLEKGNVATDWTPAPEDVEAEIDALAGDIGDVSQAVTDLDGYVDGSFKDGVINEAEAKAIEKYLNVVNTEKADVDAKYTKLYGNSLLAGTAKTGLSSAKSSYNTAHTNLISAINSAISDGKATATEKTNVDSKFTAYKTALTNLSTAFETASAYLVNVVNDKIEVEGGILTRLNAAEQKIEPNAIITTVSQKTDMDGDPLFAKTSEVKQTVDEWTATFSEIGGRNLLRNSDFSSGLDFWSPWAGSTIKNQNGNLLIEYKGLSASNLGATQTLNLPIGDYTISAKIKRSSSDITTKFQIGGANNDEPELPPVGQWGVITSHLKNTGGTFYIYRNNPGATGTLEVEWIMLEKGSVATDWTPAPEELYTGITKIDKDGVTVGKEGSTIVTNLHNEGVSVMDGTTKVATFNGGVSEIPNIKATKINSNVINTVGSLTFECGPGRTYNTITQAIKSIQTNGYANFIKDNGTITFKVYGTMADTVSLVGWTGGIIDIHFQPGAVLVGRIFAYSCTSEILIRGTSSNPGTIKYNGTNPYLINTFNCPYVSVTYMNFDYAGNASINGIRLEHGTQAYVVGCDFGKVKYGLLVYTNSSAVADSNRGNCTSVSYYMDKASIYAKGTAPKPGIANYGWYFTNGTINLTDSAFQPPAYTPPDLVDTDFTDTFSPTDIYTTIYGSSTRSTYYVDVAVQGRWNTMGSAQVGYFVFGSDVKAFMNSGTVKSVKLKVRRENSTHGLSGDVKPIPYGFTPTTAFSSTVCSRGEWSNQVSISPSTIGASSTTFKFYSSAVDSGYAKFDAAELEVVVTRKV